MVQETDGGAPVDCGLALVGPNTSLNEVRTQVREANEDDEDDEEAEVTELSKLLAAGSFTFLLPDTKAPVRRKQEKLVKGKAAGDPVLLTTTKAKKANANEGEDAAAMQCMRFAAVGFWRGADIWICCLHIDQDMSSQAGAGRGRLRCETKAVVLHIRTNGHYTHSHPDSSNT